MFNARGLKLQKFNDIRLITFFCYYQSAGMCVSMISHGSNLSKIPTLL
jgi:hypothetical protein